MIHLASLCSPLKSGVIFNNICGEAVVLHAVGHVKREHQHYCEACFTD